MRQRGGGETDPVGVSNLLQRVSCSLILTITIINVERAPHAVFLLLEVLAGKCNFIIGTKN